MPAQTIPTQAISTETIPLETIPPEKRPSDAKPPKTVPIKAAPIDAPPEAETDGAKTTIEPFEATPFPFHDKIPEQNDKFLDVDVGGRLGHKSPRGGIYWEDQTYRDKDVLLSIPAETRFDKPLLIILFMHGNQSRLDRDVRDRQHVPRQLAASNLNAVLVAPQFALDALDSSAGHFWDAGFMRAFLAEAVEHLTKLSGDPRAHDGLTKAPVVIVAYSGGYLPTVFALQWGGDEARIHGVVLLDALYAEEPRMAEWVARRQSAFFFSAYSPSTQKSNETLQHLLQGRKIAIAAAKVMPASLQPGSVTFLATDKTITHRDFLSRAWTSDPVTTVLSRIKGYDRAAGAPIDRRPTGMIEPPSR